MNGAPRLLLAVVLCSAAIVAQRAPATRPNRAALAREAGERRQALAQTDADRERLLDQIVWQALGLPRANDDLFALSDFERARPRGEVEASLLDAQRRVVDLGAEADRLRVQLHHVQAAATARAAQPHEEARWQPSTPPSASATPEATVPAAPVEEPALPAPEPTTDGVEPTPGAQAPQLTTAVGDRSALGRALFRAGRYADAVEQLAPFGEAPDATLIDLFYLARAYEKSGDLTRADSIFLRIEGVDTTEKDGNKTPGLWAKAAAVARQQMNWMHDHAAWREGPKR